MWNMLKSDLYQIFHTKSFRVTIVVFIIMMIMLFADLGVSSNMLFASYKSSENSLADFLYYFPKAAPFQMFVYIYLCIFICGEYQNGYVKNIYPYFQNKWKLAGSRYLTSIAIYLIFASVLIVLSLIISLVTSKNIGNFSIVDYVPYYIVQVLINSTISLFLMFSIHLFRSKTISIILSIAYSMMLFWGLNTIICQYINFNYSKYTIYYLNGNLPYTFDSTVYFNTILITVIFSILFYVANGIVLQKKDL